MRTHDQEFICMSYSVVIPSRNIANLNACVGAIRAMGESCRIVVVWDGDGSTEDVLGKLAEIPAPDGSVLTAIPGEKPFIFARNCNIGIRAAAPDDVILLNDDALLRAVEGFKLLSEVMHNHPEYGAMCPGFTHGSVGTKNLINRGRMYPAEEKEMLVFACAYIPRSTIDRIGLLEERFAVNAGGPGPRGYGLEDDDYSLRIRHAGLKLGVYDGVLVDHLLDSTGLKLTFRHDPEHPHDVRVHEDLFTEIHGHWPEGHGFAPGRNRKP